MEEWQRKHITENLPELIRWSRFNVLVKAELTARNILGQVDVENLVSTNNKFSDMFFVIMKYIL